jgi:hypothetical protein
MAASLNRVGLATTEPSVVYFIHIERYCFTTNFETDPAASARQKAENHARRVAAARQTTAETDAYFASVQADHKARIGW